MRSVAVTAWQQDKEQGWLQLRSVGAWLRTVRCSSLHLVLAVCLIEPFGCLLHCSFLITTGAPAASSPAMSHHSSHTHHTGSAASVDHSAASSQDAPFTPVAAISSVNVRCGAHITASSPSSEPAPTNLLSLHAHLLVLALGVVVTVGLVWQQALLRPTPPPSRWSPPQLRRPPKFYISAGSCRLA
jgi:hypothetical protein